MSEYETDPILVRADEHTIVDCGGSQIIERQDREFYVSQAMEHIKDIRNKYALELADMEEQIVVVDRQLNDFDDSAITEYENTKERYNRYNDSDASNHPRVLEKKDAALSAKIQLRVLKEKKEELQTNYDKRFAECMENYEFLSEKFMLYGVVIGSNDTLQEL